MQRCAYALESNLSRRREGHGAIDSDRFRKVLQVLSCCDGSKIRDILRCLACIDFSIRGVKTWTKSANSAS